MVSRSGVTRHGYGTGPGEQSHYILLGRRCVREVHIAAPKSQRQFVIEGEGLRSNGGDRAHGQVEMAMALVMQVGHAGGGALGGSQRVGR